MPGEPQLVIPVEDHTQDSPVPRARNGSASHVISDVLRMPNIPSETKKQIAKLLIAAGEAAAATPPAQTSPGSAGPPSKIPPWLVQFVVTVGTVLSVSLGQGFFMGGENQEVMEKLDEISLRLDESDERKDLSDEALMEYIASTSEKSTWPDSVVLFVASTQKRKDEK